MTVFGLLSIPLAAYVAYAVVTGTVWVHQGPFACRVVKSEDPTHFWVSVIIYAALAIALATLF